MKDTKKELGEFKDLAITIPLIIIAVLSYFFTKEIAEAIPDSLFTAVVIVIISLLVMFFTISITKHKKQVWYVYEKPKEILENSLEPEPSTRQTVIFVIFSAILTFNILLLSLSLSPESFSGLIPIIGEEFRDIIENSVIATLHILRNVVTTEKISIGIVEDSVLGIMIFTIFMSSGSAIMYSLKLQRAKIKKESLKAQTNEDEKIKDPKKERFPGSRSVIIFFYVSTLLVIKNTSIEYQMLIVLTSLVIFSTLLMWIWFNVFSLKSKLFKSTN